MYKNSILDGETGGYQPVPMQWISSGKLTKLNETKLGFYFYKESKIKSKFIRYSKERSDSFISLEKSGKFIIYLSDNTLMYESSLEIKYINVN